MPDDTETQPGAGGRTDGNPVEPPTSRPVGDAIPAPVEPGLDQPLPEKDETSPADNTPTPPGVQKRALDS